MPIVETRIQDRGRVGADFDIPRRGATTIVIPTAIPRKFEEMS